MDGHYDRHENGTGKIEVSSLGFEADSRKSVTGFVVYLEDAPVALRSVMQKIIALSVTEAELIASVQCVQKMFFVKKVLESMGLQVKFLC